MSNTKFRRPSRQMVGSVPPPRKSGFESLSACLNPQAPSPLSDRKPTGPDLHSTHRLDRPKDPQASQMAASCAAADNPLTNQVVSRERRFRSRDRRQLPSAPTPPIPAKPD